MLNHFFTFWNKTALVLGKNATFLSMNRNAENFIALHLLKSAGFEIPFLSTYFFIFLLIK